MKLRSMTSRHHKVGPYYKEKKTLISTLYEYLATAQKNNLPLSPSDSHSPYPPQSHHASFPPLVHTKAFLHQVF